MAPQTIPEPREKGSNTGSDTLREFYEADGARRDHWSASRSETFVQLDGLRYDHILAGLRGPYDVAVDLGCGSGVLASRLASVARMVLAMDLTSTRLEQVRANVRAARPVQGDARSIPLRNRSVDLVVASELIEHLPDYRPALLEAARVLVPGGDCVVSVPYREEREEQVCPHCRRRFPLHGHLHSFDEHVLARELRAVGLLPCRVVRLNNAVATRMGRLLAAPYPLLALLDSVCRRLLPHMNRHLILFACKEAER